MLASDNARIIASASDDVVTGKEIEDLTLSDKKRFFSQIESNRHTQANICKSLVKCSFSNDKSHS